MKLNIHRLAWDSYKCLKTSLNWLTLLINTLAKIKSTYTATIYKERENKGIIRLKLNIIFVGCDIHIILKFFFLRQRCKVITSHTVITIDIGPRDKCIKKMGESKKEIKLFFSVMNKSTTENNHKNISAVFRKLQKCCIHNMNSMFKKSFPRWINS